LEEFFNNNFKKILHKIEKFVEKYNENLLKNKINAVERKYSEVHETKNNINMQIVTNNEDEKIFKKIRGLFQKISNSLNINEDQKEESINLISKSIIKGNKNYEVIYDDTMKFLSKYIFNDGSKAYFSKK